MRLKYKSTILFISLNLIFPLISISETVNYTYDSLNRVIQEQSSDGTVIVYTYDPAGNRTSKVVQGNITSTTAPATTTTTAPLTVIELASFYPLSGNNSIALIWKTESEIDNAGFNLYRAESRKGKYSKINKTLIPAEGNAGGASYKYEDKGVRNGKTYYYKLEDVDTSGKSTMHGPVSATPRWVYGMK